MEPRGWTDYTAKFLTITTVVMSVFGIIGYSVDLYRHGQQKDYIGWFSSAGFVLLTIPISIRLIVLHLTHWNAPSIQKYVVRIIWMIPIYSTESWLALRFKAFALYFETLRECYEAYVLFSFFYFLIALMGDEQQIISKLKMKSADFGKHKWPVSLFLSPWIMGPDILNKCKFGVFQYVVIKNIMALVVCIFAPYGWYVEGKFYFTQLYLYEFLIKNMSQLWALYCLILFYFATREELTPWRPVGKFLCVKMVIFFTWWQSIVISALTEYKVIDSAENWTVNEVSKGLQDYLICIEMFFAAIAFSYAFTHKDYSNKNRDARDEEESRPFLSALLQSSLPDDILSEFRYFAKGSSHLHHMGKDSTEDFLAADTIPDDALIATAAASPSATPALRDNHKVMMALNSGTCKAAGDKDSPAGLATHAGFAVQTSSSTEEVGLELLAKSMSPAMSGISELEGMHPEVDDEMDLEAERRLAYICR